MSDASSTSVPAGLFAGYYTHVRQTNANWIDSAQCRQLQGIIGGRREGLRQQQTVRLMTAASVEGTPPPIIGLYDWWTRSTCLSSATKIRFLFDYAWILTQIVADFELHWFLAVINSKQLIISLITKPKRIDEIHVVEA